MSARPTVRSYDSVHSQSGLSSQASTGFEFDSKIEETFAAKWHTTPETAPWRLYRETEILHCGQSIFLPDFVFQHPDGRRVLMEIIGFWTPEYLRHKQEVLSQFRNERIILAVAHSVRDQFQANDAHRLIEFKTALSVHNVLSALQECDTSKVTSQNSCLS
jgi:predicted nuclease of restriction endonuclease-like RecB superfamily